jgi:hypothetical protein
VSARPWVTSSGGVPGACGLGRALAYLGRADEGVARLWRALEAAAIAHRAEASTSWQADPAAEGR